MRLRKKKGDRMIKIASSSRIEIWGDYYINDPSKRAEGDREAVIVQIEHAEGCNYMVEVLRV